MNIGFILYRYTKYAGVDTWCRSLINRLQERGHTVRLGILSPKKKVDTSEIKCEVFYGFGGCRKVVWRSNILVLWFVDKKIDKLMQKTPKPPAISVSHGGAVEIKTREMLQRQSKFSSRFVYVEDSAKGSVPENLWQKAICIPNAPDPNLFNSKYRKEQFCKKIKIPQNSIIVSCMSRIHPGKGLLTVAQAVKELGHPWKFITAGIVAGKHCEEYSRLLKTQGAILLPPTRDMSLLTSSDFFASCSATEGSSYAVLESFMAGIPVVSTKVGILLSNPGLAKITDGSVQDLKKCLTEDYENKRETAYRVCKARRYVTENLNIESFVSKWEGLLSEHARKP